MTRGRSRSLKAPKATYAERVLGSFTQIQRDHKRHSIHIATLRAQVQKNAAAQKDKLGPHWKSWVGKAVHKLQDEGFFEPSEPAGSVVLTPEGRKAIQAARRALDLPSNNEDVTHHDESLLWKEALNPGSVIHMSTSTSIATPSPSKRRTRHSLASQAIDDGDSESEELSRPSRKRPRTSMMSSVSTRSPRKPLPTNYRYFTKAQLIQEITSLNATREAERLAGSRAESPLTELDDDDVPDHTSLDFPGPGLGEAEGIRTKFATAPVMRTQSGSLINLLSKRPTPAPTEIDPNEQMDMQLDEQIAPQAIAFDNTTVTDRNPFHVGSHGLEFADLRAKYSSLESTLATRTREAQDHANLLQDREAELATLRDTLAARSGQLEEAKISGEELAAARSLLQKEMEQLTTRISELDRTNASLTADNGSLEMEQGQLISRLEDAQGKVVQLSSVLASLEIQAGEAEAENSRLVDEKNKLLQERDNAVAEKAVTEAELGNMKTEHAQTQQRLVTAQTELSDTRTTIEQKLRPQLEALDRELTKHVDAERVAGAKIAEAGKEMKELRLRFELAEKELKKAKDDNERVKTDFAVSEGEKEKLGLDIVTMQAKQSSLIKEAEDAQAQFQAEIQEAQRRISVLDDELNAERGKRKEVEQEMAALRETLNGEQEMARRMRNAWKEWKEGMASVDEAMGMC